MVDPYNQNEDESQTEELSDDEKVLRHLDAVLATQSGILFIKYLFKNFGVGEVPDIMCRGENLLDRVSFLRAGNSIYKLAMAANPKLAGQILAEIEEEKNNVYKKNNSKKSSGR